MVAVGAKKTSLANLLEMLDDRIRCTHEETVAVFKPWEDIGSNKSLGCVFKRKMRIELVRISSLNE